MILTMVLISLVIMVLHLMRRLLLFVTMSAALKTVMMPMIQETMRNVVAVMIPTMVLMMSVAVMLLRMMRRLLLSTTMCTALKTVVVKMM